MQKLADIQRDRHYSKHGKIRNDNFLGHFWIFAFLMLSQSFRNTSAELILRVDPLALVSATLKTYRRAVCDTHKVILSCPRGTSISIEVAQYSKQDDKISIDELCPLNEKLSLSQKTEIESKNSNVVNTIKLSNRLNNSTNNNSVNKININLIKNSYVTSNNDINKSTTYNSSYINSNDNTYKNNNTNQTNDNGGFGGISTTEIVMPENCMWPNGFQYSLLQTVVEACQKKKHCKFNARPGTYGIGASGRGETGSGSFNHKMPDPCPRVRKLIEIAYKCRPYEFRSKVVCQNENILLECNPYTRIAVYSASFGRTEYESIQCSQPHGVREETCLASYATETVMQICHGRRRCNMIADENTFGSPCHQNSRMYLKVVYTCVPKQVLKERFESISENDELEDFESNTKEIYDDDQYYKETEVIPKLQNNLTTISNDSISPTELIMNKSIFEESLSNSNLIQWEPMHTMNIKILNFNKKLHILLILVGIGCIMICFGIVLTYYILKKRDASTRITYSNNSSKNNTTSNSFHDRSSDVDVDIDLTVNLPVSSVSKNENLINYSDNMYGNMSSINQQHRSNTLLHQNQILYNIQSPDIIGITNPYLSKTQTITSNLQLTYDSIDKGIYDRTLGSSRIDKFKRNTEQQNPTTQSPRSILISGNGVSSEMENHIFSGSDYRDQQKFPSKQVLVVSSPFPNQPPIEFQFSNDNGCRNEIPEYHFSQQKPQSCIDNESNGIESERCVLAVLPFSSSENVKNTRISYSSEESEKFKLDTTLPVNQKVNTKMKVNSKVNVDTSNSSTIPTSDNSHNSSGKPRGSILKKNTVERTYCF